MTDRELLEDAAKAAGIYLEWDGPPTQWQPIYYEGKTYHSWNPLTDDGDALRLAVKLGMNVYIDTHLDGCGCVEAYSVNYDEAMRHLAIINIEGDPYSATRRAIVRAAAEIGRSMK